MLKKVKIKKISKIGTRKSYDIWNKAKDCFKNEGNFLIQNVVVHNSIPEAVANRDDKEEKWKDRLRDIHPELLEILEETYGVIVWQEQLQAIWQRLAGFTAPEAQKARKAVAKKWVEQLKPIRQKWIDGASKKIGEKNAIEYWGKMETFGRYAFNKCLHYNTRIRDVKTGEIKTIEEWYKSGIKPSILSYNGDIVIDEVVDIHYTGEQEVLEITFDNGQVERVTPTHKFLCEDGEYHEVREIINKGLEVKEIDASQCGEKTKSS